jgi:hypothetical protein
MLSTICTWTHEWSDMPSRCAVTSGARHSPFSRSLPLAAASSVSRRSFPRVGARTRTSAIASAGRVASRSGRSGGEGEEELNAG